MAQLDETRLGQDYLAESARVLSACADACLGDVAAAAQAIATAFRGGHKVLICGNGGSAADSQHIAAEFVSTLTMKRPRPGLPAISLTTDTSFLTANANDFGFDYVFARQVEALGAPGDVLIGISTSGNSANVVRAFDVAAQRQITTVAFVGGSGGEMRSRSRICISVPSPSTQHIQESHMALAHIMCELVERYLYPDLFAK